MPRLIRQRGNVSSDHILKGIALTLWVAVFTDLGCGLRLFLAKGPSLLGRGRSKFQGCLVFIITAREQQRFEQIIIVLRPRKVVVIALDKSACLLNPVKN
jgi:hypothetical protein